MKKVSLKKKRVTITMEPDLYAQFHRFGQSKSWSDDKTGAQLIGACFKGSVYSLLREVPMKQERKG